MKVTAEFEKKIAPFYWIDSGSHSSVALDVSDKYLQEIFDLRANEGFIYPQLILVHCRTSVYDSIIQHKMECIHSHWIFLCFGAMDC